MPIKITLSQQKSKGGIFQVNQENETSVWTAMLLLTRSVVVMATAAEFALMKKGYKGNEQQVLMITMVV